MREGHSVSVQRWRLVLLVSIPLAAFLLILLHVPIPQDRAYHDFADRRTIFGIPHFANVISNVFFLAVGIAGLVRNFGAGRVSASFSWITFFVGVLMVAFGSGYYHLAPDSDRLLWDRVPMTVAFMGLFVALLEESVRASLGRYLLIPAVLLGLLSIYWWMYADDLRLYVWVQFAPLLMIPIALSLFPPQYSHRRYLLYGLALYGVAKLAELYDWEIFQFTDNTVSGHSLKHILASASIFVVYVMLRWRQKLDKISSTDGV